MELHSQETLTEFIEKNINNLDEHKVREFASKIGNALEYLHESGIAVRALDNDGILMSENIKSFSQRVPRISRLSEAKVLGLGDSEFLV